MEIHGNNTIQNLKQAQILVCYVCSWANIVWKH